MGVVVEVEAAASEAEEGAMEAEAEVATVAGVVGEATAGRRRWSCLILFSGSFGLVAIDDSQV